MSLTPLIYSNRKQVSGDPSTGRTEPITLIAATYAAGNNWSFTPSANVVSGSTTGTSVTITLPLSAGIATASWRNVSNTVLDQYGIICQNYPVLAVDDAPHTIYESIYLPIPLNNIYVGTNDFGEASVFNTAISKLDQCFDYLVTKSKVFGLSPAIMSMRYGSSSNPSTSGSGQQWQNASISQYPSADNYYWSYTNPLSTSHISANSRYVLRVEDNVLKLMSATTNHTPTVFPRSYSTYSSVVFDSIVGVVLEEIDDIIWVLESNGRLTKLQYLNGWKHLNTWKYTTGTPQQLITPVGMAVDASNIYIVSKRTATSSEYELRIFDRNFQHVKTVYNENIPLICSVCLSRDYVILLSDDAPIAGDGNVLYMLNKTNHTLVKSVGLASVSRNYLPNDEVLTAYDANIKSIYPAYDDYFIYGITKNQIYKFTQEGMLVGFGGDQAVQIAFDASGVTTYTVTGVAQDKYSNLYVSSSHDIVRYFDAAVFASKLLSTSTYSLTDALRSSNELEVHSNENCAYWVYNRIFNRFYDNLELFRNTILGKLKVRNRQISLVGFNVADVIHFPYTKDEIFVGINELHCEATINRNIKRLYECLEVLANMINLKDIDIPFDGIAYAYWNGAFKFDGLIIHDAMYPKP